MNRLFKRAATALCGGLAAYTICAFIPWEWDPVAWGSTYRAVMLPILVLGVVMGALND